MTHRGRQRSPGREARSRHCRVTAPSRSAGRPPCCYSILGLLARHPSTGYELTQTFDRSLRTSWHASHSQIYPELAKLERAGLVEVVGRGARRSKTYGLTAYERDLSHVEGELHELEGLRAQVRGSEVPEAFAPQVELGIRIDSVIRDWLREQIEHAAD